VRGLPRAVLAGLALPLALATAAAAGVGGGPGPMSPEDPGEDVAYYADSDAGEEMGTQGYCGFWDLARKGKWSLLIPGTEGPERTEYVETTDYSCDDSGVGNPCRRRTPTREAKGGLGNTLWYYRLQINWCWGVSGRISYIKTRRIPQTVAATWRFIGHIGWSPSGGVGHTYYTGFTQGKFWLCASSSFCPAVERLPWIQKTVYGDGTDIPPQMGG
jgi:hypothetical protein